MDWFSATLRVDAPNCPARPHLDGARRMRCLSGSDVPWGILEGTRLNPLRDPKGRDGVLRLFSDVCPACPLRNLPEGVYCLQTKIGRDGTISQFLVESPAAFQQLLRVLEERNQRVQILRAGKGRDDPNPHMAMVPIADLTPMQGEALRQATRLGCFRAGSRQDVDDLARALACSRSAAHEHLRKGLEKVMENLFLDDDPGVAAVLAVENQP